MRCQDKVKEAGLTRHQKVTIMQQRFFLLPLIMDNQESQVEVQSVLIGEPIDHTI